MRKTKEAPVPAWEFPSTNPSPTNDDWPSVAGGNLPGSNHSTVLRGAEPLESDVRAIVAAVPFHSTRKFSIVGQCTYPRWSEGFGKTRCRQTEGRCTAWTAKGASPTTPGGRDG